MPDATERRPSTARVRWRRCALAWTVAVAVSICLARGAWAAEPLQSQPVVGAAQGEPPLPTELSVWNWLRQSQFAPATSFNRWVQDQQGPAGLPEQALWNAPVNNLVPVPDAEQTAAISGLGDTRLNQGTLIEAVPPVTPPPLGRRLTQAAPIELAQQPPPPDTGIQSGESEATLGPKESRDTEKKLGKAPVDYSLQFLRTQSVLLRQGQCQFDTGAAYGTVEANFPTVVNGNLTTGTIHRRLGYVPAQIRYGLTDRIQCYVNCPVGYVCNEQTVLGQYANYSGRGGTGDTNMGASFWVKKNNGCPFDPDIILTAGFTIPTAPASFITAFNTPQTSLGQGFWAATWNALVVQTYDPVTVFYGVGGRQMFGRDVNGTLIQPGQQFIYQLGAGFAINERITLSATYFGYFISDTYENNQRVAGSVLEPQYMRFALTVVRPHRIIEPFVLIGTTIDAARSIFGVNLTFY